MWKLSRLSKCIWHCRSSYTIEKTRIGVRGIQNKWFASYHRNRKQSVLLNVYKSNLADVKCEAPQGSILGPLCLSSTQIISI